MKRVWMLASAFLVGCMWGGMAELIEGEKVVHKVKGNRPPHACACDSNDREEARAWVRCEADGAQSDNGTHYCCPECGKVCGRVLIEKVQHRPPVPVPLPPQCDAETHCKDKEACVVGDHKCCAACHQACF